MCACVCKMPVRGEAILGGSEYPRLEQEISGPPLCGAEGCSISCRACGCKTGTEVSRRVPVFWFLCLFSELMRKSGACSRVPFGVAQRRGGMLGVPVLGD